MPQKELVFSPSLLAIIADSAERIVFIQEEMGRFLSRPVTDYHGRNLYETVEEMTEEPLVVLPDGLGAGVLLHDQGKTYGLTLQKLMTGGIVTGIAGLIQENEAVEKQLEYELGLSVQRYKSALLQSSNVIWLSLIHI